MCVLYNKIKNAYDFIANTYVVYLINFAALWTKFFLLDFINTVLKRFCFFMPNLLYFYFCCSGLKILYLYEMII